ncbi:hypothetical protein [Streptomyces sp. NPDC004134]|uniref:hypothetical protein n=1 Tax=Streptomyces sp. NPDC004134 TaxID=3364691 RepID=UPI0036B2B53D
MTLTYWERHRFDDPAVAADRGELLKSADQNPDPYAAFLRLLRSGQRDACTALEYFHYQDRQARWGFGNPLDEYAGEVLDRARWVLRGTPLPEARGEDRASALWAIQNHAEAADAPLITAALRAIDGDVVDDGAVSAAGSASTPARSLRTLNLSPNWARWPWMRTAPCESAWRARGRWPRRGLTKPPTSRYG